jgi:hypothetical protein
MRIFSFVSRALFTVCIITVVMLGAAFGQSTFGTILGVIRDASGGVMPGCAITIENAGTSSRRSVLLMRTDLIRRQFEPVLQSNHDHTGISGCRVHKHSIAGSPNHSH